MKKLPLPKELKNIPKGYVYLGNGDKGYRFNKNKNFKMGQIVSFFGIVVDPSEEEYFKNNKEKMCLGIARGMDLYYFVKADSEIARLNGHKPRNRKKKEKILPKIETFSLLGIQFAIFLKDDNGHVHPIGRGHGFPNKENNKVKIDDVIYDLSVTAKHVDTGKPLAYYITVMPNQWTSKEMRRK